MAYAPDQPLPARSVMPRSPDEDAARLRRQMRAAARAARAAEATHFARSAVQTSLYKMHRASHNDLFFAHPKDVPGLSSLVVGLT